QVPLCRVQERSHNRQTGVVPQPALAIANRQNGRSRSCCHFLHARKYTSLRALRIRLENAGFCVSLVKSFLPILVIAAVEESVVELHDRSGGFYRVRPIVLLELAQDAFA